jgi:hypothetical protein
MFIEPPPRENDINLLRRWCVKLHQKILEDDLKGSATWDPGSIADGDEEATTVTVTGAVAGDYAIASFTNDVSDLTLDAQVTAANTVTCVLANNTGDAVDLASGTVYVRVFRRTT